MSHAFLNYDAVRKVVLSNNMEVERIEIPPLSDFLRHVFLQHGNAGWSRKGPLQYHLYIVLERYDHKDAEAFAYGVSFHQRAQLEEEQEEERSEEHEDVGYKDISKTNQPKEVQWHFTSKEVASS